MMGVFVKSALFSLSSLPPFLLPPFLTLYSIHSCGFCLGVKDDAPLFKDALENVLYFWGVAV